MQGLDDVEVIRVRCLNLCGNVELTMPLFELTAAPAVGGEVPHHPPAPSLRVVVMSDTGPVLPDTNEHFLHEILRILLIAGEKERLSDKAMDVGVKEELELLTPFLIVHRAPQDASLPNKTPNKAVALHPNWN